MSLVYAIKTAGTGEKRTYGVVLKATAVEAANETSVEDINKKVLDIFLGDEDNVMDP